MRTHIMLLAAAAAMLTACADDQHPTSPATRSASRSADVAPSTPGIGLPAAKPTDQVGFTQVFSVMTDPAHPYTIIPRGTVGTRSATCPAGSVAVGGSYGTPDVFNANELAYVLGGLDGNNGWFVKALVPANASALVMHLQVSATCIQ